MAIIETDILYRLTEPTGPGNSNAQGNPYASLGGYLATSNIDLATPLNNLWDDEPSTAAVGGSTEFRCIAIVNNSTQTWFTVRAWLTDERAGGAQVALGVDPTAATTLSEASQQFVAISSEDTAPAGVTFTFSTSKALGINMGDILAGYTRGLWMRRSLAAGSTGQLDGITLRVEGDST